MAELKEETRRRTPGGWNAEAHIRQEYAGLINELNRDYLNPYLNFHRPCFFPEVILDARGKELYRYERMMTPYEKLKSPVPPALCTQV